MKFLGNVLSTLVGLFVFVMLIFGSFIFLAAIFGDDSEEVLVESDSVLEIQLQDIKNDYAGKFADPWVTAFSTDEKIGVIDIINAIENAKTDDDIKGISILNNSSELGMAQQKAIRNALEDFKKSGKFVWSYANYYTQKEYYLSSVAQNIYINPVGFFDFKGMSAELMFFKDLQEMSGINMEVIRHGKYKSAVEPFLENQMSEANKEQTLSLLNSIWTSIVDDISVSRKISTIKLNEIASGLLARTPEMAKAEKLIDFVAYEDEYHNAIRKKLNLKNDEEYSFIRILDYAKNVATTAINTDATDKIAVIFAQGEILNGEGDVSYIGEGSINRSLIEARKDKNIKSIVLRVDSPGGNALTSDLIWREIELTKKVKPVVVSMGNYAASGGYYIACNANKIFAENNTITGSIGVFGVVPNFSRLATKNGIHTQQVNTNENAADYSPFLPMNENFRTVAQEGVERIYKIFLSRVAQGRKMTVDQVDTIAQGRVWSGQQALKIGLVDKIGGLKDAIKEAASLSKTMNYTTVNYPEYKSDFSDMYENFPFGQSKESFIKKEFGTETFRVMEQLKKAQTRKGVQALLPFELNIK